MLACALGLACLGQPACLQPFVDLALPGMRHGDTVDLVALAPGAALHEVVAIALGLIGLHVLTPLTRALAGTLLLVGGSLGMGLFDVAVLAVRTPAMPVMVDSPQSLEYLAFGLVLAAWVQARGPSNAPVGRAEPLQRGQRHGALRDCATALHERTVLEVVVLPHCFSCARARNLAAEVAAHYPALEVRVVDLGQPGVHVPRGVVAVPAYVLDGHVLFTGNPTPEALTAALSLLRGGTNDDHGE
jgi:hypothetical protein